MQFNDHSNLRGYHAELSPSSYHWLNYDEQKMRARYTSKQAARRGTRIHNWAHEAINLGLRQKENGATINKYINDGIRYRMMTDFVIFVNDDAFGEADNLSYRQGPDGKWILRIHDLKTGLSPASIKQLEVYAAYFCLEYDIDPDEILILLFLYQNDAIVGGAADPVVIRKHMTRTKEALRQLETYRKEDQ